MAKAHGRRARSPSVGSIEKTAPSCLDDRFEPRMYFEPSEERANVIASCLEGNAEPGCDLFSALALGEHA
jgi:hypothetical protein